MISASFALSFTMLFVASQFQTELWLLLALLSSISILEYSKDTGGAILEHWYAKILLIALIIAATVATNVVPIDWKDPVLIDVCIGATGVILSYELLSFLQRRTQP
jgi:hypothetical protein